MNLQREQEKLQKLKARIEAHKKRQGRFRHELSQSKRKLRTRQLIQAGSLFEKTGILGQYDENFILGYLYASCEAYENVQLRIVYQQIGESLKEGNDEQEQPG
ncbi:conjugal transfer protein TraD [Anaerospora hongkongensis]|uniref:conjugal transfer protein TraD n=1 Tax=Anaerospora hongkongensis TaxID=244830 RepID=UPI002899852A|nr:conjugal transfer protein TraD [Anaerospora hongkongensis]